MAVNLADIYEKANSDQMTRTKIQVNGPQGDPKGKGTYPPVNFSDDDYQVEFRSRSLKPKEEPPLSELDDETRGTFTSKGLNYYGELVVDSKLISYHGRLIQQYNARATATYYSGKNSTTKGVLNSYPGV